jgi:hypothetical protein
MSTVSAGSHPGGRPAIAQLPILDVGGDELVLALRGALAWLQAHEVQINELNVFPVPDGDTGSNMLLTLRSAVEDAQAAPTPTTVASVMNAAARGALMGARGNSGVILSQVIRGVAHRLDGHLRADAHLIAAALGDAAKVADAAVMNPIEGTILTVVRDCASAAAGASGMSTDLRIVLDRGVREAYEAVARTTDQLPVLRDAGVVDAGGLGFAVILEGFSRAIAGVDRRRTAGSLATRRARPVTVQTPRGTTPAMTRRGAAAIAAPTESWGFCTEFVVEDPVIGADVLRALLAVHGDSLLVVGDATHVRVHIHTLAPAEVVAIASRSGALAQLKIEDMSAQHHTILQLASGHDDQPAAARRPVSVVPVASGIGFEAILRSLGATRVVAGGQTMNPSAGQLLSAVRAANTDAVILLPNNDNIIRTAQQVQALADDVEVRVVPTRNVPQGIGALLSWDPAEPVATSVARMHAAAQRVRSLEITRAARNSRAHGREIAAGDVIALINGEIAHCGSDDCAVVLDLLRDLAQLPELVTIYRGAGVAEQTAQDLGAALESTYPAVAVELHYGGQPHYPYVLSLE